MKGIIPEIMEGACVDYDPTKSITKEDINKWLVDAMNAPRRKPEYLLSKHEAETLPLEWLNWLGEECQVLCSLEVSEIVLFTSNPDDTVAKSNHNDGPIAAIVTRVWSSVCVNIKIIPDGGPMQDRSSVTHASANPAGYHFQFMNEVYPETADPRTTVFK